MSAQMDLLNTPASSKQRALSRERYYRIESCIGQVANGIEIYQTVVPPSEIKSILGHDPRYENWKNLPDHIQRLYKYLQRNTSKSRRIRTKNYILERFRANPMMIGMFPSITIGCQAPILFEDFSDSCNGLRPGTGYMNFDISGLASRILLDGLGRVTAALDLFEDPVYRDQISFDFPVTFIAPSDARGELTEEELGQLFHDFNFTATPIQKGHAIDLDRSNLYIQAANKIGRIQTIRMAGGVEARAASLGKKSTALVAQQVLVRFTRGALEGTTFQDDAKKEIPDNPVTNATNVGERISQIEEYLDLIANEMGDQWKNHELLHLTAPGWNALGGVFHDIYVQLDDLLSKSQQEELTRKIGNIDWSRANQDFIGYLGDPVFVDAAGNKVRTPTERKQYSPDELSDWVGPDGKRLLGAIYGGRRGQTAYVEYIRRSIGLKPILASVASSTESDANLFENLHQDE